MNGYVTGTNTDKRFKFDIDISEKFLSNYGPLALRGNVTNASFRQ